MSYGERAGGSAPYYAVRAPLMCPRASSANSTHRRSGWKPGACALLIAAGLGLVACQKSDGVTTKEDPNQDASVRAATSSTPESASAASEPTTNPAGSQ